MDSDDSWSTQDLLMDEPAESHQFLEEAREARPRQTTQAVQEFDPHQLPDIPKGKVISAKNWFLTFPQVTTTKEEALERLKAKLGDKILGILIAQENHSTTGECSES